MKFQASTISSSLDRGIRFTLALLLLTGFVWVTPARHVSAGGGGRYQVGEVIVQLNPLAGATIDDINTTEGTTTLQALEDGTGIYLLQLPAGTDAAEQAGILDADPRLAFAEPNFISQVPEANPRGTSAWGGLDPAPITTQYAVNQIGLPQAWALSRGQGSLVAVIDTGVQLDHPALAASFTTTGYDFIDNDNIPVDSANGTDSNQNGIPDEAVGHGTHVSGIVHLVAPAAQIMPIRALDSDGNGDVFTLARAMLYAIQNHADVINLSLGTPDKSDLLKQIVRTATRNNIVVVAAAGNLNSSVPQYPAGDGCAISVTAVGPMGLKSEFANYDGGVDFAASGESIYSAFPIGGYAYWSGTSMATPFVAGQVALLHSLNPTLDPRDLVLYIGATAHSLDTLNPLFAGKLGFGLVNVGDSLNMLASGIQPLSNRGLMGVSCVQ